MENPGETLTKMIELGVNPKSTNRYDLMTPLMIAIDNNDPNIFGSLLPFEWEINVYLIY